MCYIKPTFIYIQLHTDIQRKMASKTIMIQEETYQKLAELRRGNESFNDIIRRLIYKYQDLTPYFGIISSKNGDQIEKAIEEAREANDVADLSRGDGV